MPCLVVARSVPSWRLVRLKAVGLVCKNHCLGLFELVQVIASQAQETWLRFYGNPRQLSLRGWCVDRLTIQELEAPADIPADFGPVGEEVSGEINEVCDEAPW